MRYEDEVYTPISQEDWNQGGGPATLDEVFKGWRDEFARVHGRQPADIEAFRLWYDGLTYDEFVDTVCRVVKCRVLKRVEHPDDA